MARNLMREGWRVLRRCPGVVIGEIIWRWLFGATALVLVIVGLHTYFLNIEISEAEYRGIKSLEPFTWLAIAVRVFSAVLSGIRAIGPILIPSLTLLWIALATVGRSLTVRSLASKESHTNWLSLTALNFFRALMLYASLLAFFGIGVFAGNFFDPQIDLPALVLIQVIALLLLAFIWSIVNWYVSNAAIFAAKDAAGLKQSFEGAARLYSAGLGRIGTAFSVLRTIAVIFATFVSLAFAAELANGHRRRPIAAIIVVTLAYFAFCDFLYMWRLACYLSLTDPACKPPALNPPVGERPSDTAGSPAEVTPAQPPGPTPDELTANN